jgi:hypothetical protein
MEIILKSFVRQVTAASARVFGKLPLAVGPSTHL